MSRKAVDGEGVQTWRTGRTCIDVGEFPNTWKSKNTEIGTSTNIMLVMDTGAIPICFGGGHNQVRKVAQDMPG
jgi:hypothetical protein